MVGSTKDGVPAGAALDEELQDLADWGGPDMRVVRALAVKG
jgi:hypothetical protein